MKNLFVLGSLNMDLSIETDVFPSNGQTVTGANFITNPGGKGANQAVASAKSETETLMIGAVGQDVFGDQLLKSLKSSGVNCEAIRKSTKKNTGVAMITRYEQDNRIILEPGANHTVKTYDVIETLEKKANKDDIFLTQFENDFHVVLESLEVAKAMNLFTVLNPAPARLIPEGVYSFIDLLIVNQSESELLSGMYPDTEEDCKAVIDYFDQLEVGATLVTLGKQGSVYGSKQEFIYIPSYEVEAIDSTGAGDAYIGALLSSFSREDSIKESMVYATKAAALTVMKLGAQEAIPVKKEIDLFKGLNTTN